ncbi:MAG: fumarylacetoacetate hydrolase family protein [Rhodospirillaceae bacterium]|nr:fumarylacetoacetate hydrolase family protein [Rhodospirillaceae bacterium]
MSTLSITAANTLPAGGLQGCFVGRIWLPMRSGGTPGAKGAKAGPTPVLVADDGVYDLSATSPTLSGLLAMDDPAAAARDGKGEKLGEVTAVLANSAYQDQDQDQPYFLAPSDLQALKACGVTFVRSMLERVIEEQAKGDPDQATEIRKAITAEIGQSLADVVPGSDEAARIKAVLTERGLWSQYLEVGIGPDAEVFTKSQPMAAVGTGAEIGIHPKSTWNNPEPEVVLAIAPSGTIVGACLGNDVNLRDFEGRSALLLGKAKDNRGSCAVGPFIRLFDDGFNLDHVRAMEVSLSVTGADGFELQGQSSIAEISRDLGDLAAYACGAHNQFPDGLLLFTGTMFAPTEDRDAPGQGFTHHLGDIVTIANPLLGSLTNQINHTDKIPPWTFGIGALMKNLAGRGLL